MAASREAMENESPPTVRPSEGIVFRMCVRIISDRYFSIAPRGRKVAVAPADCDSSEARVSADGEHYIPAIFFISFSLFNASMGVSESMSSPLIWSRI